METEFPFPLLLISICIIIFICEKLSFGGFISSSILGILDSTVKANESNITETTVEASDFPVALRSPDPQVSNFFSNVRCSLLKLLPTLARFNPPQRQLFTDKNDDADANQ